MERDERFEGEEDGRRGSLWLEDTAALGLGISLAQLIS